MKKLYLILVSVIGCSCGFAQFQYQISYLDVSRPGGGPLVQGDILEIRAVISVPSGTSITKLNYVSTVPAGTTYIAGSMKVETNEGIVVGAIPNTGSYTDASGDDQGSVTGGGTNIAINMGTGATNATGGSVTGGTTQPLFYNVASIFMAVYRVQVTAVTGSTITLTGSFRYKDSGGVNNTKNLSASVYITPAVGCDGSAVTNLFTTETAGTFGTGNTQNRSTSSAYVTGYTFTNLVAGNPVDGDYSIVNNTSPTGYSGATPTSGDRLFGVWDVIGDHTGSSTGTGNPPAAPGSTKGYMLAVNASFAPAAVYNTTISGLLPNTNYTLSFWFYNICPSCANDPATGSSLGTPGVKPVLSVNVNGPSYFSSGEIAYSGKWVQKSFTFNTGAAPPSPLPLSILNNAPGGGGNDWVMDDLTITQCLLLLPVSLTGFEGSRQQDGTLLAWQTAEDDNLADFYVERSTDGFQFLTIGQQPSKGLPGGSSYYFTDSNTPAAQTLYYRLRMTGKDGSHNYSNVIVIKNDAGMTNTVLLAPNPAHRLTTLYIKTNTAGTTVIHLLNMAGREVYAQTMPVVAGQNALSLSLPALAEGVYVLQASTGGTTVYTKLVIH